MEEPDFVLRANIHGLARKLMKAADIQMQLADNASGLQLDKLAAFLVGYSVATQACADALLDEVTS